MSVWDRTGSPSTAEPQTCGLLASERVKDLVRHLFVGKGLTVSKELTGTARNIWGVESVLKGYPVGPPDGEAGIPWTEP